MELLKRELLHLTRLAEHFIDLAYVQNATVRTTDAFVAATEQAVIRAAADSTASSSGGSSFTGQGTSLALNAVITTNLILSKANAYVAGSFVTAKALVLHRRHVGVNAG